MDELKKELIGFWKKTGRLLASGVPFLQTLKVIQEETVNARLKEAIGALRRSVEGGSAFSEALAQSPELFPLSVRTLIKSGEVSGRLAEVVVNDVVQGLEDGTFEIGSVPSVTPVPEPQQDENIEAPVIQLVSKIIQQAHNTRASDIHLEQFGEKLIVRYRVDGVLHPVDPPITGELREQVVSRVKIMAGLSVVHKQQPQDGRMQMKIDGRKLDIRVSSVPYVTGECLVLRLLDSSVVCLDLEKQGITAANLARLRSWIRRPNGLIIVTGPTGCGKTTTLYGVLQELNRPEIKILTVEDPVEYVLGGVGQQRVNVQMGVTFATALRAELRQDPDVLMCGEIRDLETAQICLKAALTGHLVLTTLHTNDACEGIRRLLDIGLDPFLVNATLTGIWSQRLVRKVCAACRHEVQPPEWIHDLMKTRPDTRFYEGQGCEQCKQTRYRGRTGIHEFLEMNDDLRKIVSRDADVAALRMEAVKSGMIPIKEDGFAKATEGVTTVEEVLRVCGGI